MSRDDRTRRYETMIVLRADLLEAGVKEQVERVRKQLETHGAEVGGIHDWGLRELAYPIEKQRRGYYVLVEYTGGAVAVGELERSLKLSDAALRFITVRQDQDTPPVVPPQRYEAAAGDTEVETEVGMEEEEDAAGVDTEVGDIE